TSTCICGVIWIIARIAAKRETVGSSPPHPSTESAGPRHKRRAARAQPIPPRTPDAQPRSTVPLRSAACAAWRSQAAAREPSATDRGVAPTRPPPPTFLPVAATVADGSFAIPPVEPVNPGVPRRSVLIFGAFPKLL